MKNNKGNGNHHEITHGPDGRQYVPCDNPAFETMVSEFLKTVKPGDVSPSTLVEENGQLYLYVGGRGPFNEEIEMKFESLNPKPLNPLDFLPVESGKIRHR